MKTNNIPLNYITLKFDSEKLEEKFYRYSVKQSLKLIRVAMILGCLLILIFGILDIWMVPEKIWTVWGIRIGMVLVLVVTYILSFNSIFKKYARLFMSMLIIILGMGIISMVLVSESTGGYFYYAGLMLVIQFAHGLIRLRFVHATIATIFIALTYLLIAWGIKNTPGTLIINNSFFLFSTIIIGMFISYSLEFYMRNNFWQRKTLSRQENLLKLEYRRKTRELDDVRQLQLSILPQNIPLHPNIDLAVSVKTALEIGGDYYDYNVLENKKLNFAIGDATGHGAQAGALVTASKILFTCWKDNQDIETFVNQASSSIKQMGMPKLFMAMIAGTFNNGNLEVAGGGLPPALFYRKQSQTLEEISLRGFPLGCVTNYSYKKINIGLQSGDLILFMTDGLTELFNSNNEMLGLERIKHAFCEVVNEKPSVIINYLNKTAENWRQGFPLKDDVTFLVFKVNTNSFLNGK